MFACGFSDCSPRCDYLLAQTIISYYWLFIVSFVATFCCVCFLIQCVDKLSEEQPLSIFLSGALQSCLSFLDFFSLDVQRRTMKSATRLLNAAHAWASSSPCQTERTLFAGSGRSGVVSRAAASTAAVAAGQETGAGVDEAEAVSVSQARTGLRGRVNGWVVLGDSNSTSSREDAVAASGGGGQADASGGRSLSTAERVPEGRGPGSREGEQALIQKLEQRREEFKSLVLPVLPTLSGLLVYEDQALVQVRHRILTVQKQ